MLSQIVLTTLAPRLINSLIAGLVIIVSAIALYLLFFKKPEDSRERKRIKYRIIYIAILIFLLVLIRIWIEGFTHLFTMLSLIAAGLVVTNKENIMNISGWLIINWRDVFAEGDFIQIQQYTGYVDTIKLLSFKLFETNALDDPIATGKTIKIPNGLVITNPVTLLTANTNLILNKTDYPIKAGSDPSHLAEKAQTLLQDILTTHYAGDARFSKDALQRKNRVLAKLIDLKPNVDIAPLTDKEHIATLKITFYSFPKDAKYLKQVLLKKLFKISGTL